MAVVRHMLQAVGFLSLLLASGCDRAAPAHKAIAAGPNKPLPHPSPTAHLILLPDSAISVERGSTEEALATFLASKEAPPRTFRFQAPEFEPWHSKPNPATLRTVFAVAQILRAYPKAAVTLIGHTDNDGTAEQNIRLSEQRAQRMAALLTHAGIARRRIATIGHGMADPIADNATEQGRTRNRRIELIVTAK